MKWIPRETAFFALFNKQVGEVTAAAQLFREAITNYQNTDAYGEQFSDLEHAADLTTHEIIDKVNRTFITPIDREDIYTLAHELDDVIDMIDASFGLMLLYEIAEPTLAVRNFAQLIFKAVQSLQQAIQELEQMSESRRILDHCIEIHRLENEGDRELMNALKALLHETTDAMTFVKMKQIYEYLEETLDRCEDVANTIEGITIKHS